MKQRSPIHEYSETEKQQHAELRFQIREKDRMLRDLDYQVDKGIITTIERTKLQVQLLTEFNQIREKMIKLIQ